VKEVALPDETPAKLPVALLGGVFDPLHLGHVEMATAALQLDGVEEVRWIPCKELPHDKAPPLAPLQARLEMVKEYCSNRPGFVCDEIEYHRDGPSWTIETVRALGAAHPGKELLWLIGADNADQIGRWKDAEELWHLAIPVVAHRPGAIGELKREELPFIGDERWQQIDRWHLPAVDVDISSTRIRALLSAGEAVDNWIPESVLAMIESGGWYYQRSS